MKLCRTEILLLAVFFIGNVLGFPSGSHNKCSQCPPGTRVKSTCTDDIDTSCVPCEEHRFTDKENSKAECDMCSECPVNTYESKPCSSSYDTICTPCSEVPTGKSKNYVTSCLGGYHDIMVGDAPPPSGDDEEENLVDDGGEKDIKVEPGKEKIPDGASVDNTDFEADDNDDVNEEEGDHGKDKDEKVDEKGDGEEVVDGEEEPQNDEKDTEMEKDSGNGDDTGANDKPENDKPESDVDDEVNEINEETEKSAPESSTEEFHEPEPELDDGLALYDNDEGDMTEEDENERDEEKDKEMEAETDEELDTDEQDEEVDNEEAKKDTEVLKGEEKMEDDDVDGKHWGDEDENPNVEEDPLEDFVATADDGDNGDEMDNEQDEDGNNAEDAKEEENVEDDGVDGKKWGDEDENPNVAEEPLEKFTATGVDDDEDHEMDDGLDEGGNDEDEMDDGLDEGGNDEDEMDDGLDEGGNDEDNGEDGEFAATAAEGDDNDEVDDKQDESSDNAEDEKDEKKGEDDGAAVLATLSDENNVLDKNEPGDVVDADDSDKIVDEQDDDPELEEKVEVDIEPAADGDEGVDGKKWGDEDENPNVEEDPLEEFTATGVDDDEDDEMDDGLDEGGNDEDEMDDGLDEGGNDEDNGEDGTEDDENNEEDTDGEEFVIEADKAAETQIAPESGSKLLSPNTGVESETTAKPDDAKDGKSEGDDAEDGAAAGGIGTLGADADSNPVAVTTSGPGIVEEGNEEGQDGTGNVVSGAEPDVGRVLQITTQKTTTTGKGEDEADEEVDTVKAVDEVILTGRETGTTKIPEAETTAPQTTTAKVVLDKPEGDVVVDGDESKAMDSNATDVVKVGAVQLFPEESEEGPSTPAKPDSVETASTTTRTQTSTEKEDEDESDDDHDKDDDDGEVAEVIVEAVTTPMKKPTTERIPTLEELEAKYKEEHGDAGSGEVHVDLGTEHKDPYTVHGHGSDGVDAGHDDHVDDFHAEQSHHDSEEDKESKQRTAIIVGVAIGGVALFSLAFFTSRFCMRKGEFKIMKKVDEKKDGEVIEFQPLSQTDSNIYEEPGSNGLYRKGPSMGPHSPRGHRKSAGNFQFPDNDTYAVPDKVKKLAPLQTTPLLSESPSANEKGLYRHGPQLGPPSPRIHRKGNAKFEFPVVAPSGVPLSSIPVRKPTEVIEVFDSDNTSKPGPTTEPVVGLYRKGPRIGPPSPRMHRKPDGKFEFPAPGPSYPMLWVSPPSSPSQSQPSTSVPHQPTTTDSNDKPSTEPKQDEGLYRRGPRIGPPSPRLHRKGDRKFQFPVPGPSDPSLWPSPSPSPSPSPTPPMSQLTAIGTDSNNKPSSTPTHPEGLYRHGPRIGPPSPRMHRKQDGKFEFPVAKPADPDPKNVDTSSSLSKTPEASEPLINGEKLKYIDESTDDEYVNSFRDRHLPSRSRDPKLNKVAEEPTSPSIKQTPPVSPSAYQSNGTTGSSPSSPTMKTSAKEHSSVSGSSQGSLTNDVVNTLNQKQNGGEKKAKNVGSEENIEC